MKLYLKIKTIPSIMDKPCNPHQQSSQLYITPSEALTRYNTHVQAQTVLEEQLDTVNAIISKTQKKQNYALKNLSPNYIQYLSEMAGTISEDILCPIKMFFQLDFSLKYFFENIVKNEEEFESFFEINAEIQINNKLFEEAFNKVRNDVTLSENIVYPYSVIYELIEREFELKKMKMQLQDILKQLEENNRKKEHAFVLMKLIERNQKVKNVKTKNSEVNNANNEKKENDDKSNVSHTHTHTNSQVQNNCINKNKSNQLQFKKINQRNGNSISLQTSKKNSLEKKKQPKTPNLSPISIHHRCHNNNNNVSNKQQQQQHHIQHKTKSQKCLDVLTSPKLQTQSKPNHYQKPTTNPLSVLIKPITKLHISTNNYKHPSPMPITTTHSKHTSVLVTQPNPTTKPKPLQDSTKANVNSNIKKLSPSLKQKPKHYNPFKKQSLHKQHQQSKKLSQSFNSLLVKDIKKNISPLRQYKSRHSFKNSLLLLTMNSSVSNSNVLNANNSFNKNTNHFSKYSTTFNTPLAKTPKVRSRKNSLKKIKEDKDNDVVIIEQSDIHIQPQQEQVYDNNVDITEIPQEKGDNKKNVNSYGDSNNVDMEERENSKTSIPNINFSMRYLPQVIYKNDKRWNKKKLLKDHMNLFIDKPIGDRGGCCVSCT